MSHAAILFMYRNTPSVVIGRNQNIWTESNRHAMEEGHVHLVRRKSGGGAVFHVRPREDMMSVIAADISLTAISIVSFILLIMV